MAEAVDPGYGFTGHQVDPETGLGCFRARYYDPEEGRFLSTDPLGFPDGPMNAYAYVANAPTQSVDQFGLSASSFSVHAKDRSGNDVYADLVHGAVFGHLLNALLDFQKFMLNGALGQMRQSSASNGAQGFGNQLEFHDVICSIDVGRRVAIKPLTSNPWFPGGRKHGNDDHWALIVQRANDIRNDPKYLLKGGVQLWTIKMNQQQENSGGWTVSFCQPDLQYNYFGGVAHMVEEFFRPNNAHWNYAKGLAMIDADPFASYLGFQIGRTRAGR